MSSLCYLRKLLGMSLWLSSEVNKPLVDINILSLSLFLSLFLFYWPMRTSLIFFSFLNVSLWLDLHRKMFSDTTAQFYTLRKFRHINRCNTENTKSTCNWTFCVDSQTWRLEPEGDLCLFSFSTSKWYWNLNTYLHICVWQHYHLIRLLLCHNVIEPHFHIMWPSIHNKFTKISATFKLCWMLKNVYFPWSASECDQNK